MRAAAGQWSTPRRSRKASSAGVFNARVYTVVPPERYGMGHGGGGV